MRFVDANLQKGLIEWRASTDAKERSAADNLWFEQRISRERQQAFENLSLGIRDADDLRRWQTDYWEEYVRVDTDIAYTFDIALDPADLGPIDQTQRIIRIEDLSRALAKMASPMSFSRLKQAVADNETVLVDAFLRTWDQSEKPYAFASGKINIL